jgi:hypothetical protein
MVGCNRLRVIWFWMSGTNGLNLAPGKTRASSLPLWSTSWYRLIIRSISATILSGKKSTTIASFKSRKCPLNSAKDLEQARTSGVLDWDCFKGDFSRDIQNYIRQRHLPWMAPPLNPNAITLARPNDTNLPRLSLTLEWTGRDARGGVLYSRAPRTFPGESVMVQGKGKIWAFSAVMRLTKGSETLFEKTYQREEWKKSYSSAFEQPLWKTSEAILQDIKIGLRPKPALPADTKKSKKRSKSKPEQSASS